MINNQLILALKQTLEDKLPHGPVNIERQRNILKEELQYYVLDFIYHHLAYSRWVMYGGSALRICHGLNRMSVDLDFEINYPCTEKFLEKLKTEIAGYFASKYGIDKKVLDIKVIRNRGLLLKFVIGDILGMNHPSKQVHVKIDLNHFEFPKAVTERIPIHHDQLSFVLLTYNKSTLMSSKIAAIFLRGQRGVGKEVYEEKGRDIYDLLWYMEQKIIPNLDYLSAKGIEMQNIRHLFDNLTVRMNRVSKANLRQDLFPLFLDQGGIQNWISQWHESYLHLVDAYKIRIVTKLREVRIRQDFDTDNWILTYEYATEEEKSVLIQFVVSDYWIKDREGNISIPIDEKVVPLITSESGKQVVDRVKRYTTLFHQKIETYLKRTDRIILGTRMETKLIRMTATNLRQKEQIVLNRSALLSCSLEALLK